jgi:hypothetical protein
VFAVAWLTTIRSSPEIPNPYAELGDPLLAGVALPRAAHDGLGHAEPRTNPRKHAAHGAHRDGRPLLPLHLEAQQLARPRRAIPAEVQGRAPKKPDDALPEASVHLRLAVVAPLS